MKKSDYEYELKNVMNNKNLIAELISGIHDSKTKKEITPLDVSDIKSSKTFKEKLKQLVLNKIANKNQQV